MADLNEYGTNPYTEHVKPNIFETPVFGDEEKDAARKALKLIIAAEDKGLHQFKATIQRVVASVAFIVSMNQAYTKL